MKPSKRIRLFLSAISGILAMAFLSISFAQDTDGGATPIKLTDENFVVTAYESGLAEIEASKHILKKSDNDELRTFAEQMVRDHQSANMQLKNIAEKSGIVVPKIPANEQMLNKIESLTVSQLEEAYIRLMKNDHDAAVALFELAADTPSLNADLRTFASQTLPILRMHQQHAHMLGNMNVSHVLLY